MKRGIGEIICGIGFNRFIRVPFGSLELMIKGNYMSENVVYVEGTEGEGIFWERLICQNEKIILAFRGKRQ